MRWQDLKDLFRNDFDPIHASIATDPSNNRSRGYGIVRFSTLEEAEDAVAEMNGATVSGRAINVRLDRYTAAGEEAA